MLATTRYFGIFVLIFAFAFGPCAAAKTYLVNDYGARGDGSTLDTAAIQKTIDFAARAGGIVDFKPGRYLTGSLFLRSGTVFKVGVGVTLIGSQKLADYPM